MRENLRVVARLRHVDPSREEDAVEEAMRATNLVEYADVPTYMLSAGFRGRLNIATCLVSEPELIVLDEPTAFIDVVAAEELLRYIKELSREKGISFFYTTHRALRG